MSDASKKKKIKFIEFREMLGLNQTEMSAYLGMHPSEISRIEAKKKVPAWLIRAIRLDKCLAKSGYRTMDLDLE